MDDNEMRDDLLMEHDTNLTESIETQRQPVLDEAENLEVNVEKDPLLKALSMVLSAIERRNTVPILSNVCVTAAGQSLGIMGTDMEISVASETQAHVIHPGRVTVPAMMLHDIVRKLPDGAQLSMKLDAKAQRMRLDAGTCHFTLATLPAEHFPVIDEGQMSHQFQIKARDLQFLVEKVRFAMSSEETRYYLNGIYFHTFVDHEGNKLLRSVATDGHRLARAQVEQPFGCDNMPGVIVPRKTVSELKKLLEDEEQLIHVSLSDKKIRFSTEKVVLLSKLIEGNYPDYERLVPEHNKCIMEVDADALAAAVDRVTTVSAEKVKSVKLEAHTNVLKLSSSTEQQGSANEELSVDYGSQTVSMGFNAKYMLDMLSPMSGCVLHMMFENDMKPPLIKDATNDRVLYVIMPMRM